MCFTAHSCQNYISQPQKNTISWPNSNSLKQEETRDLTLETCMFPKLSVLLQQHKNSPGKHLIFQRDIFQSSVILAANTR